MLVIRLSLSIITSPIPDHAHRFVVCEALLGGEDAECPGDGDTLRTGVCGGGVALSYVLGSP